jgi:hypothetical protein
MDIVEDLIKNETENQGKWDQFFTGRPVFYFAKDFEFSPKSNQLKPTVTIKPSVLQRLLVLPFLAAAIFFWLILLSLVLRNILLSIALCFLLLLSLLIVFVIWSTFINPKYSYKISIDKEKISIHKLTLKWELILEVIVMVKGVGRNKVSTLVVFTDDNNVYRFPLRNLGISEHQLLTKIEVYRKSMYLYHNSLHVSIRLNGPPETEGKAP